MRPFVTYSSPSSLTTQRPDEASGTCTSTTGKSALASKFGIELPAALKISQVAPQFPAARCREANILYAGSDTSVLEDIKLVLSEARRLRADAMEFGPGTKMHRLLIHSASKLEQIAKQLAAQPYGPN
jgi:hypothetical protein